MAHMLTVSSERNLTPAQQVIASLDAEPECWRQTEYTLRHENGVGIWTANGPPFLSIHEPDKRRFSLIEKLRVWAAIRRWSRSPIIVRN